MRCCFVLNRLLQNRHKNGRNCASVTMVETWGLWAGVHCREACANPRNGASPGWWCLDNPGHPLDPWKEKQSALVQPTAPPGGPHGSILAEEQVWRHLTPTLHYTTRWNVTHNEDGAPVTLRLLPSFFPSFHFYLYLQSLAFPTSGKD